MTLTPAQRQTASWLLIAAALLLLLWLLAPVLAPFLIGAVLAYALQPPVEALVRRRWPRSLAVALVVLLAAVLALALALLLVPVLVHELPALRQQLPLGLDRLGHALSVRLADWGLPLQLDLDGLKAMLAQAMDGNVQDWAVRLLSSAKVGGSIVLTVVGNAVLVPVVLFYLLLDWPALMQRLQRLVPPRLRPAVEGFLGECDHVLGQYLRGQLMVMLILATYYAVALAIAGLDLALPVGVFTGLAVFIPYLGFGLGLALALLTAALQFGSWYGWLAVAAVYGAGQVLEGFFLTPRLVGERIGLHPLAVIFALLAFGQLLGFVGVLAALPLSAVALVAGRRLLGRYLQSGLYGG
jgi:predicted PurR-regulated permease PerM